jgi:hypothetical protein
MLDLMEEQEIGWDKGGTDSAGNYKFSVRMRVTSERWYFSCMMWKCINSKEGELVSDRVLYDTNKPLF